MEKAKEEKVVNFETKAELTKAEIRKKANEELAERLAAAKEDRRAKEKAAKTDYYEAGFEYDAVKKEAKKECKEKGGGASPLKKVAYGLGFATVALATVAAGIVFKNSTSSVENSNPVDLV